ncbi:histone-lysine N-methyltransferase PRDM9-like, partial [Clarias magur]
DVMNLTTARQRSCGTSGASDSARSQLCEDVKAEMSDRATLETSEFYVKKEETLELTISNYEDDLDNIPEVISIKEEDLYEKENLYCELCKCFFFNKCEVHGPPFFISDTPALMGVSDRARHTLPPGLEIRESGIPDAGLGVFNKGETIPLGAHFGPYQGELVDQEEAVNSGYSWVICRSRQCDEYIDAKREMYANWMRYINCSRNDDEQNLVAFQYRGGILFRCCRPIDPGQELLVWFEDEYAKELGPAFDYLWNKKSSPNDDTASHVFSCSTCPLSYASQVYLDKHMQRCRYKDDV